MNTVTASVDTAVRQMTEMFQRKKNNVRLDINDMYVLGVCAAP